jgi:DNA polymerase lambda
VKETIYELVGSRDLHEIEACGSYRRNKDFCGDIDIIITRRDGVFEK